MAVLKCKMCGGTLDVTEGMTVCECEYCGTQQTITTAKDENLQALFNRANILRMKSEFDKAEQLYEKLVQSSPDDAEAHWGLILCKYGIEYVEDPATFKRVPTCHRTSFDSIIADEDYKEALRCADVIQRGIYEAEAKEIDRLQKEILALSAKEDPYDVFICYKESDNGSRTPDSVIANDIYHQLTNEGFKVFYAAITLEDKLGSAYEPCIFAALNSAKVMLAIGTRPEYFNAVWVKNEWSRYLKMMKKDRSKLLIPCYKDMDAYELPEEFAHLQAQDMSKIGFINDIVRGIKKVIVKDEPKTAGTQTDVNESVPAGNPTANSLVKRAFIFLEDGEWQSADEYCEKALDIDPENAQAYLGKLMAELKVHKREALKDQKEPFDDSGSYQKIMRYGDETLKAELTAAVAYINERNENTRLEGIYQSANRILNRTNHTDTKSLKTARRQFVSIGNYKDAEEKIKHCDALILETENNNRYMENVGLLNSAKSLYQEGVDRKHLDSIRQAINKLEKAKAGFEKLNSYKNSAKYIAECDQFKAEYEAAIPPIEQAIHQKERELAEQEARIAAQKAKKRKRITLISVFSAVVIAAAVCVTIFVIVPEVKYSDAQRLYDSGQYDEAAAAFEALGDFKDSAAMVKYTQATELYSKEQYADAVTAFAELGDFRDAKERHKYVLTAYNKKASEIQKLAAQSLKNANYFSAGKHHTVGLKADGTVVATGDNSEGQCDVSGWKDIIAVSAGNYHTVGLKVDGTVVAVGAHGEGQCNVSGWKDIIAVSAGFHHTVGLKADGTVVTVGDNGYGPCDVSGWKDIIAVSAGLYHIVGLKADGTVVATGKNDDGQCDVSGWKDIIAVSAGLYHTVGSKADGTVVATGENDDGRCNVSGWKLKTE